MKNIFVYDKKKYFYFLLKRKYSKEYNFVRIKDAKYFQIENFSTEDAGVFIVYDDTDILSFLNFNECFDKKRILVCTEKIVLFEKYYKLFKIKSLDISKPKINYYQELDFRIKKMLSHGYSIKN